MPEIWVSFVFWKVLLLLLRLTINKHSQIKKKMHLSGETNRDRWDWQWAVSPDSCAWKCEKSNLWVSMHSKSCARQLYWGLIWVAALFHAHTLWLSLGRAPWGLWSRVHHRQVRPPHRAMCACKFETRREKHVSVGGIWADVLIQGVVFLPNNWRWESIECSRYFIKTPRDRQCRTVAFRWNLTIIQHVDNLKSSTSLQWGCCCSFQIPDIFQIFFHIFDNILYYRRPHHWVRKTWEFQSICLS